MAVDYKLTYITARPALPSGPATPNKWIAALNNRHPFYIRFEYPSGWSFVDFKVFQIKPHADKGLETKARIMSTYWNSDTVHNDYKNWPDPILRYSDTFKKRNTSKANTVVIWDKMTRRTSTFSPAYDLILRFEDDHQKEVLVDPPIRNEF